VWSRRFGALAAAAALGICPAAYARPLLLPSPVLPLDSKVPLRTNASTAQLQLPINARTDSRERVLVRTLPAGRVVGVRVVQRLTLTGTGDYFLSVPAPLLDARAAPGSQAEPGFRRSGILWQGFANRRRVLAADAVLDPARAASALPLRLELSATVDGRPLESDERRSGRLRLELKLRNTTAVRVPLASTRASRPRDVQGVVSRLVSQIRRGEVPDQPTLDVAGPIRTRQVAVDAPLVVAGQVRLRARRLDSAVVRGGSLVRRAGEMVVPFKLVLADPERTSATIAVTGSVDEAAFAEASLTAEPSATAAIAGARRAGSVDAASRLLLRLARVRQYDAFLANPAPGGSVEAVYRFQTTDASVGAADASAPEDEGSPMLPVLAIIALTLGAGGLVVLWAHL
jgi:hypothetical protein